MRERERLKLVARKRLTPTSTDPDVGPDFDGEQLANDVFDIIHRGLPRLAADDPLRPAFAAWLPVLGEALGRPRLQPVDPRRAQ